MVVGVERARVGRGEDSKRRRDGPRLCMENLIANMIFSAGWYQHSSPTKLLFQLAHSQTDDKRGGLERGAQWPSAVF
jgi:hypothetical protein